MKGIYVFGALMTIAILLMLGTAQVWAGPGQIQWGLKLGLNISDFSGSDVTSEIKSKTGFAMGISMAIKMSDQFAIQPEMLYTMKGAKADLYDPDLGTYIHGTYKLSYIEIPVLAKVMISTSGNVKPEIYAGPALSLKTSSKIRAEALGMAVEDEWSDVKSTDFGLVFGAGLGFKITSGIVTVDGRYNLGMANIDSSPYQSDIKNGVFSIFLGYGF